MLPSGVPLFILLLLVPGFVPMLNGFIGEKPNCPMVSMVLCMQSEQMYIPSNSLNISLT